MMFRSGALLLAALCVGWAGAAQAQSGFAVFSAVINADGTGEQYSGVVSSERIKTGDYRLIFVREVDACSIVATPRGLGGGQASASVTAKPKRVRVRTFSRTGQVANLDFSIIVSCTPASAGSQGMALLHASIDPFGNLIDGAGAVAAGRPATGIYTVTFNRAVLGCGYAATAGPSIPLATPDTSAEFSISPLEGDSASVIVRRNSAVGNPNDGYFHVVVLCAQ